MEELQKLTEVVMIYGTPEHEPDGSLEIFKKLGVTVFDKPVHAYLGDNLDVPMLEVYAIPEPRSSHYEGVSPTEKVNVMLNDILSVLSEPKPHKCYSVVMYHGEVKGARYQNGMEAKSSVALTKEQLRSANADYYALGHIHQPQEVFSRCWYAGSAYPIDFGESHDAGYNLITFEEGNVNIERISFGFPRNLTLDIDEEVVPSLFKKDFTNTNVKVRFTCKDISIYKNFSIKLHNATNALSVRTKITEDRLTNIRSKDIVEQQSTKDKFKTYAEVNKINYKPSVLDKIQMLEENMLTAYTFPKHSFELIYVKVRGAIGISHHDEYEIDFEKFDDGIIALIGLNGAGKTTLIENCHPYPCMLTRSGKLTDHFSQKDSLRELIYRDENNKYYRIIMNINGAIKTGSTEYLVYTSDDKETWVPVSECNGNLKCYETWVEETFGSKNLFLSTCFTAKEETDCADISNATATQNMELFGKLLGLSYYTTLSQFAKEQSKVIAADVKAQCKLIEGKTQFEIKLANNSSDCERLQKELDEKQILFEKQNDYVEELQKKYGKFLVRQQELKSLNSIVNSFKSAIKQKTDLISEIEEDKRLADEVTSHERDISLYHSLSEKVVESDKKIKELEEQRKSITDKQSVLMKNLIVLNEDIGTMTSTIIKIDSELKHLEQETGSEDICPVCGNELSADKKEELKSKIVSLKNDIKAIEEIRDPAAEERTSLEKEIKELDTEIENSDSVIKEEKEIRKNFADSLKQYEQYAKLENFNPKFKNHEETIKKLKTEITKLETEMSEKLNGKEPLEDVTQELSMAKIQLDTIRDEYSRIFSDLKVSKSNADYCKEQLDNIKEYEKGIIKLQNDQDEFDLLAKAFSTTGIQALELEANIPQIADYANSILHESYGDKFDISFVTQKDGAKSAVFQIVVTNNETNRTYPISMLSSGERIWVKQAIFSAFSIVRINATGFCFKTRFMDETDGSLDGNMRVKYMKMISAVNSLGNSNKTILITHSQELKDVISQVIEL